MAHDALFWWILVPTLLGGALLFGCLGLVAWRGGRGDTARNPQHPTPTHSPRGIVWLSFFSLFHINYNKWGRESESESESESRVLLSIVLSRGVFYRCFKF